MGGATVPANAEMPGLAAIVMEVAVHIGKERCTNFGDALLHSARVCSVGQSSVLEPFRTAHFIASLRV